MICHETKFPDSISTTIVRPELPRSGCIQQPGVAAQRRTPGKRIINRLYAEGVPQLPPRGKIIPTRIVRQTRRRTFEATGATHPEISQFDDAPAGPVCNPSRHRHGKGLLKTHRILAAIETRLSSVSTTSKIRVLVLAPDRRLTTFLKADKGCGRGPQRHRFEWKGSQGFGTLQRGMRGAQPAIHDRADTVSGASSRKLNAGKPARETGPSLLALLRSESVCNRCGTLSAFASDHFPPLGCAAARRPQANGCNRFAVLLLKLGEAHRV